jgi:hypothetical protein
MLSHMCDQVCVEVGRRLETCLDSQSGVHWWCNPDGKTLGNLDLQDLTGREAASQREAVAINYWAETQEQAAMHEGVPISFTLDATGVGKNSVQDCAVVWPSNVGAWLFPQACPSARRKKCLLNNPGWFSKLPWPGVGGRF